MEHRTGLPDRRGRVQQHPPGLDLDRLAAHLGVGALTGELIAGGRSNLTYRVTDGESRWVVRRPPLGHVLPTAHDMAREYRVIGALAGTRVPVPRLRLLCQDQAVIGAPFYVMDEVPGVVLRTEQEYARLTPDLARRCGEQLVDVLLELHRVEPEDVGLGDFGRPEGYLARQVARWHRQWEHSATRDLPALEAVTARLRDTVPAGTRHGIVHGDYRLDNVMYDDALDHVVAVLDWEMATVGDPLADVGLLYVYAELTARGFSAVTAPLDPALGFPSGAALLSRYCDLVGVRPERLGWYVALGYYKLAIISEGIHARYLAGETVGPGFGAMGEAVPTLVGFAADALER
jgi:aminoglycoside phosphotransferase (APT) family kinase protein